MGMAAGGKGVTSEINVTPLIDVVLVLLIIFMVITPMLQKGFAVQLPLGQDPGKKPDSDEDVIVSIQWTGPGENEFSYHYHEGQKVKETQIPEERLAQLLSELKERSPSAPLFIKADKRLRYGIVKGTMIMCETAGFHDVSLVAEQPG